MTHFRKKLARGLTSSVAIFAVLATGVSAPVEAGVGDDMQSYFDDMGGAANVTGPSAYEGQSAGYYTLGSAWSRFPQKTVSPANIQLPKVTAGCGGIDVFAGSFSFINMDEFIANLKAIANNSLGFAFQLAIESISPQIAGNIRALEDLVNKVNSFNISSCEAAAAAVGSIWPRIDKAEDRICQSIGMSAGQFSDSVKARRGCGNGGERSSVNSSAADPALAAQVPTNKNYAWDMISNSALRSESVEMRELIMNLVGTIIVGGRTSDSSGVSINFVGAADSSILDALLDGNKSVTIQGCVDSADCLRLTPKTISALGTKALKPRVSSLINGIMTKVRNDQPLNSDEVAILGIAQVPLYKIVAVHQASGFKLSQSEVQNLAEVISVNLLGEMVEQLLSLAAAGNNGNLNQADEQTLSQFRDQVAQSRQSLGNRLNGLEGKMNLTFQIVDQARMIEATLQSRINPGFSAALNFSRGLNSSGLQ